jgi:hypothetical protein
MLVDCQWGEWSAWSACPDCHGDLSGYSKDEVALFEQLRTRKVMNAIHIILIKDKPRKLNIV